MITLADSVCWLHNIRGSDLPHTPFVLGFAILHADGHSGISSWTEQKRSPELITHLGAGVRLRDPSEFEAALKDLANHRRCSTDPATAPTPCSTA